jgi:hypothetical protein
MLISEHTHTFIEAVQQYSGDQLKHAADCALLVEAAESHSLQDALADLCFTSKFLHKTFGVMKRIGPLGEGYGKLSEEFESNSLKALALMQTIADTMPADDRRGFTQAYCAVTAPAFEAMMELVHDLSWLKNYSIDTKANA